MNIIKMDQIRNRKSLENIEIEKILLSMIKLIYLNISGINPI